MAKRTWTSSGMLKICGVVASFWQCAQRTIQKMRKRDFSHPDSVLKLEDFSVFKANWNTKPENIREIAAELNIGLDSIVFVDDNPAERDFVAEQLPEVAVPNVGSDVSSFAEVLEHEHYFEMDKLVQDDLNRSAYLQLKCGAKRRPVQILRLWRVPGLARNDCGDWPFLRSI